MPAPFFIVGPTAVGKSGLAAEVAARCGAEIVGADAFQIYAGFDQLTAKPSLSERRGVPHYLIGTVSPGETYNVARYLEDARQCLAAISERGHPAIVVGGTGLYVKALTHGLSPLPEADPATRAELEALDTPTLLARLRELDPVSADRIDVHNRRRLIRAVEVCVLTGRPFSSQQSHWSQISTDAPNGVFLVRSKDDLHARIQRRVDEMFAHGVIEEVAEARSAAISQTAAQMIGFREVQAYLSGQETLEQCQENIRLASRQYAKRQITWFQREKSLERIDLTLLPNVPSQIDLVCERFQAFLQRA